MVVGEGWLKQNWQQNFGSEIFWPEAYPDQKFSNRAYPKLTHLSSFCKLVLVCVFFFVTTFFVGTFFGTFCGFVSPICPLVYDAYICLFLFSFWRGKSRIEIMKKKKHKGVKITRTKRVPKKCIQKRRRKQGQKKCTKKVPRKGT